MSVGDTISQEHRPKGSTAMTNEEYWAEEAAAIAAEEAAVAAWERMIQDGLGWEA